MSNTEDISDTEEKTKPSEPEPSTSSSKNAVLTDNTEEQPFKYEPEDALDKQHIPVRRQIPISSAIKLLIPISIAMFVVIMYVKFVCLHDCSTSGQTHPLLLKETGVESKTEKTITALLNSLIIISVVIVITCIVVLLFYFRCDKIIHGYIGFSFFMVFVLFSTNIYRQIMRQFNIPFDIITGCLLLWNYSVSAMISIFWRSPLFLQQIFLVNISIICAINIMYVLPEWTSWGLLMLLVIWDLIAVLCPFGPLRLLVSTFKKRKEEDKNYSLPPGLIYSTMISFTIVESVPNDKKEQNTNGSQDEAHEGPRLGLGDFVFYSLLMGKTATYGDFNLILGCYVGIIFGLLLTLVLLVIFQMPLPALPISITFGVLIFFISHFCVTPFLNKLNSNLIYF